MRRHCRAHLLIGGDLVGGSADAVHTLDQHDARVRLQRVLIGDDAGMQDVVDHRLLGQIVARDQVGQVSGNLVEFLAGGRSEALHRYLAGAHRPLGIQRHTHIRLDQIALQDLHLVEKLRLTRLNIE